MSPDASSAPVDSWADWIDRTETSEEGIAPEPSQRLATHLGRAVPSGDLPPLLWPWLQHLEAFEPGQIGAGGHFMRDLLLPPILALRRMSAGGEVKVQWAGAIGQVTRQARRIAAIEGKAGSSGPIHTVIVAVETEADGTIAIEETRRFICLDALGCPWPSTEMPPPHNSPAVAPDAPVPMRFSGLTYNRHSIKYDADHVRSINGYPERLFRGPPNAIHRAVVAQGQMARVCPACPSQPRARLLRRPADRRRRGHRRWSAPAPAFPRRAARHAAARPFDLTRHGVIP